VGRVLSQRNLDALDDVCGDLEELTKMEMPRPARALSERCLTRVKEVVASARASEQQDEQQGAAEGEPVISRDVVLERYASDLFAHGKGELLRKLKQAIEYMELSEGRDRLAAAYRRLSKG
jgi:hypothetical protein